MAQVAVPDDVEQQSLDDTIIVTGTRLQGEASAIEEKRRATATVSIMSAEEIAKRPGGNVADIIGHMPGLVGYNDMGKGQAATGQREYVSIRGMDSNYDAFLMNGVRVPAADPGSRALSLNFVAPYGLDSVIVTKAPLSEMVGDGIGGIVDIHTPTGFSKGHSFTKVMVAGNYSQLADKLGFASLGGTGQVEVAREFGDNDQFGVYATAFYDRNATAAEAIEAGGYYTTLRSESTLKDITQAKGGLSLDQMKYDLYTNKHERWGGNLAFGYRNEATELYLRGTYGRYTDRGNDSQRSIRNDGNRYFATYAANGSVVQGDTFNPERILPGGYFQTRDKNGELYTLQAGGITDFGHGEKSGLILAYDASLGASSIGYPNYVEGSLYAPPVAGNAKFDISDARRPFPLFSSAAVGQYVMDPNTDKLWKFQGHDGKTTNRIYGGKVDLAYRFDDPILEQVKGGIDLSFSRRKQYDHLYTGNGGDNFAILKPDGSLPAYTEGQGGSLGALPGRDIPSFMDGLFPGAYRSLDRSTFVDGMIPYAYQDHFARDPLTGRPVGNPGAYTEDDFNRNTVDGKEDIYAGYLQTRFSGPTTTAVIGVRYEHTAFSADHWVLGQYGALDPATARRPQLKPGFFTRDKNRYDQWLPNFTLVYRPSTRAVARFAAHRSFSRPAFSLIAGPETRSVDPVDNRITYSRSNPHLKPAESTNLDASAEFYPQLGAILEVGGYYRNIENFIYSATTTGGRPTTQNDRVSEPQIIINQPMNGLGARIYGVEFNGRYQLTRLGGWASGFGIGGNVTVQHSDANARGNDGSVRTTWLPRAPRNMYNVDLFYDKYGFSTQLSWQHVGMQLLGVRDNRLDTYMQPINSLDLDLGYMAGHFRIGLQVKNLLNKTQFWKTMGRDKTYLGLQDGGGNGSYVETGRFMKLLTSYQF